MLSVCMQTIKCDGVHGFRKENRNASNFQLNQLKLGFFLLFLLLLRGTVVPAVPQTQISIYSHSFSDNMTAYVTCL